MYLDAIISRFDFIFLTLLRRPREPRPRPPPRNAPSETCSAIPYRASKMRSFSPWSAGKALLLLGRGRLKPLDLRFGLVPLGDSASSKARLPQSLADGRTDFCPALAAGHCLLCWFDCRSMVDGLAVDSLSRIRSASCRQTSVSVSVW